MATNYDFLNTLTQLRSFSTSSSAEVEATMTMVVSLMTKYMQQYPELKETWTKMLDENRDSREDKNAICMLALSKQEYRDIVRKLKKKTEHKIHFAGDNFVTVFRMKEDKVMAFEPDFPDGREVGTVEKLVQTRGPVNEYKATSPRGWLYYLLRTYHPTLTEADQTRIGYSAWLNIDKIQSDATETLAYLLSGLFVRLTATHGVGLSMFDPRTDCVLMFPKDVDTGTRKDIMTLMHVAVL